MLHRRHVLSCAALAGWLPALCAAQAPSASGPAAVLLEAASMMKNATWALNRVASKLGGFVTAGYRGYSVSAAEQQHERLKELSARATNLVTTKQAWVTFTIDEYLREPQPRPEDWLEVTTRIDAAMAGVADLLNDMRHERSDLVLEDTYAQMMSSLQTRGLMLRRLSALPPPSTPAERKALGQLNVEYKKLLAAFRETIQELNRYIKSARQP